jgi:hypothetical protein
MSEHDETLQTTMDNARRLAHMAESSDRQLRTLLLWSFAFAVIFAFASVSLVAGIRGLWHVHHTGGVGAAAGLLVATLLQVVIWLYRADRLLRRFEFHPWNYEVIGPPIRIWQGFREPAALAVAGVSCGGIMGALMELARIGAFEVIFVIVMTVSGGIGGALVGWLRCERTAATTPPQVGPSDSSPRS